MGGKEARAVRLMNAFGRAAHHTVLSAVPGALGARWAIWPEIVARFPDEGEAPALAGRPGLGRYWRLARYMADFDLVLSYNWGAMDGVMAHRLYGRMLGLPPLIHHEDGFNVDELDRQKRTRMLFRRVALGTAHRIVVPSARLERIARTDWGCPPARITRIANGVPLERYAGQPAPDSIPGFRRAPGDVVVGTMAGLRGVKNLPRLVRAFARAGAHGRLVIAGEGPERDAILAAAQTEGVGDRVSVAGLPARSGALCRAFRHLRTVVGQRAVPDLAGRGDGRGPARGIDRRGRHCDDGRARESALCRRTR